MSHWFHQVLNEHDAWLINVCLCKQHLFIYSTSISQADKWTVFLDPNGYTHLLVFFLFLHLWCTVATYVKEMKRQILYGFRRISARYKEEKRICIKTWCTTNFDQLYWTLSTMQLRSPVHSVCQCIRLTRSCYVLCTVCPTMELDVWYACPSFVSFVLVCVCVSVIFSFFFFVREVLMLFCRRFFVLILFFSSSRYLLWLTT